MGDLLGWWGVFAGAAAERRLMSTTSAVGDGMCDFSPRVVVWIVAWCGRVERTLYIYAGVIHVRPIVFLPRADFKRDATREFRAQSCTARS